MPEMDIYALPGEQIRFAHPEHGYSGDQDKAQKHLTLGTVYTVERTELFSGETNVYLLEVPGIRFNTVHFESLTEREKLTPEAWQAVRPLLTSLNAKELEADPLEVPERCLGIKRYYYEFAVTYQFYFKRDRSFDYAHATALTCLKGRHLNQVVPR